MNVAGVAGCGMRAVYPDSVDCVGANVDTVRDEDRRDGTHGG